MFGTSGIRGIYGKDITEALAGKVASVFAEGALCLGRDIRTSGPSLFKAAASGALSAGSDVMDLGIAPTPTVALATKKYGCRGIMLTASHNPPEYNGLKLMEHGKEIGKAMEKEVERRYKEEWKARGVEGALVHDSDILDDHKQMVMGLVDRKAIARKKPKIVVDCNGAGSVITPYLLSDLGCKVTSVNASRDCFNRPSEPSEGNLSYLSRFVSDIGADFAIAHDGDGDRCVVMDEKGEVLPLDIQLAIMIEHEMAGSKNKKIISTVEASLTIRDVVERNEGAITITPVGSTFVGDALEEKGALFGGEPCGEYIYEKGVHVPDAVLAAAKFAEIFCGRGQFSKLRTRYPQHFMARERFQAEDKKASMEKVKQDISIEGEMRSDDGIRIDEEDGWLLIRASGTEPIIRLTMEYKSKDRLERRKKEMTEIIKKNL
jgi:phosphomannomutase/phosphoglucomutase